jgi:hypothetical protein
MSDLGMSDLLFPPTITRTLQMKTVTPLRVPAVYTTSAGQSHLMVKVDVSKETSGSYWKTLMQESSYI